MAPDSLPTGAPPAGPAKDILASVCGQIPRLATGDKAALRRLSLGRSEIAIGVAVGLLVRAGAPDVELRHMGSMARWELLAHVAAVLSGTGSRPPHSPNASLGRALQAVGCSEHRLMRLTSARGPALVDQIRRMARILAAAGQVPVDLRTVYRLSFDTGPVAEAARLRIARDFYAAEHTREKEA